MNQYELLDQMIDDAALMVFDVQDAARTVFADMDWITDLGASGGSTFSYSSPGGRHASFRPHYLGVYTEESGEWTWSWDSANINADALELATALTEFGRREGIDVLSGNANSKNPSFPMRLAMVAAAYSGVFHARAGSASKGTAWFLLSDPRGFQLPAPTPVSVANALANAARGKYITSTARALTAYAARREGLEWVDEGTTGTFTTPTGRVVVTFDALGRAGTLDLPDGLGDGKG